MKMSYKIFFPYFFVLVGIVRALCPTSQIIDASFFSNEVTTLRKMLGGHTDVDVLFPLFKEGSPLGNVVIQCTCDLECHDFDSFFTRSCRWHNEKNSCDGKSDELDWIRMRGAWGSDGESVFSTKEKPDGFFLFVGSQKKLPKMYSAMLVSDPIQCQQGDGKVKFRFWGSPGVKFRVCTRLPSMQKQYLWCSETLKAKNRSTASVTIPGSIINMFEIVIEAFGFDFDAFGVTGGAAAIDDISYNSTSIFNCYMSTNGKKLTNISKEVCDSIQCDFSSGNCLKKLGKQWNVTDSAVGTKQTGIISPLESDFAFVQGPKSSSIMLGKFLTPRTYGLQFCFFSSSIGSLFEVVIHPEHTKEKLILFHSENDDNLSNLWQCRRVFLSINGTIEFNVSNLEDKHSFFGIDQIDIVDPLTSLSACSN